MISEHIESTSYWAKHVKTYKHSNYPNKRSYCLDKDLNYNKFLYWYRKLIMKLENKNKPTQESPFIPMQVTKTHVRKQIAEELLCILEFKQGHKLKIYTESIMAKLISLLSN